MKFEMLSIAAAVAVLNPFAFTVAAQAPHVDHFTPTQVRQLARALSGKAQAQGGSASDKLAEYPNHFTMIALRKASGGAEIHENFADLFVVAEGRATLLTGGNLEGAKSSGPGEIHGTSLTGASEQALGKGDIVHIPAGVPHQILLPHGGMFAYFVIKVKEK